MTPGEHLIVIGQPEDAIEVRASGMSLRDTLLVFLPGPRALFVYLFRRALDGTVAENVLKHGIGGLNIDACRIGTTKRVPGGISHTASLFFGVQRMTGLEGGHNPNLGRWPTNLLFVHGPACRQMGIKTVASQNPSNSAESIQFQPGRSLHGGGLKVRSQVGHADPDGTEAVPDWNCQPDCPVALLDEMSGLLRDHGNISPTNGGNRKFDQFYGTTDAGGASRFFPQFLSFSEVLAWLTRLVSGPC